MIDETVILKVIKFISSLRASGHDITSGETMLNALGAELSPSDEATLFRTLEAAGAFRPDSGICWCFQDLNLKALQEVAKNIKPIAESTPEVEEEVDPVDLSTFKPDGIWVVTTDSNGKRRVHFQRDKPLVSNDENKQEIRKVRDQNDGESHLDFSL